MCFFLTFCYSVFQLQLSCRVCLEDKVTRKMICFRKMQFCGEGREGDIAEMIVHPWKKYRFSTKKIMNNEIMKAFAFWNHENILHTYHRSLYFWPFPPFRTSCLPSPCQWNCSLIMTANDLSLAANSSRVLLFQSVLIGYMFLIVWLSQGFTSFSPLTFLVLCACLAPTVLQRTGPLILVDTLQYSHGHTLTIYLHFILHLH